MNDARLRVMLVHSGLAPLPDVPVAHAIVAKHTPTVYSTRARPGTQQVDTSLFFGGTINCAERLSAQLKFLVIPQFG